MNFIVVARVYLDSGTVNVSKAAVQHPTWVYEARVHRWGLIDRSIPAPSGIPQSSDAKVRLIDTDKRFKDVMSGETPRRRFMHIKLLEEGQSESNTEPLFIGEIDDNVTFGPGYVDVTLKDRTFAWIDEEIPSFINRENFPNLAEGVDDEFFPIINGHCVSPVDNPQGVIPLPHIGWDSAVGDRWGLAVHPVEDVVAIYRKLPDEGVFTVVDPSEFNVNIELNRHFVEAPTIDFTPTYVDFIAEQPAGTQIRADVDGINLRGGWEGLPPALTFQENRNPINFFINMIFFIFAKAGTSSSVWDVSSIETVLNKFAGIIPDSSSSTGFLGFKCDGALVEPCTVREFLGRFLGCFGIDMYQKSNGKIAIAYVDAEDVTRPVFKEGYAILRDSFFETLAKPTVNQTKYRFEYNYATKKWARQPLFDNEHDQMVLGYPDVDSVGDPVLDSLGDPVRIPRVENDLFDLYWTRDEVTALFLAAHRMGLMALGSYRQEWKVPIHLAYQSESSGHAIELAKLVGLTHSQGFRVGGYVNEECKVIGMTTDLDEMTVTVRTILRVPLPVEIPESAPVDTCTPWLVSRAANQFHVGKDANHIFITEDITPPSPSIGDYRQYRLTRLKKSDGSADGTLDLTSSVQIDADPSNHGFYFSVNWLESDATYLYVCVSEGKQIRFDLPNPPNNPRYHTWNKIVRVNRSTFTVVDEIILDETDDPSESVMWSSQGKIANGHLYATSISNTGGGPSGGFVGLQRLNLTDFSTLVSQRFSSDLWPASSFLFRSFVVDSSYIYAPDFDGTETYTSGDADEFTVHRFNATTLNFVDRITVPIAEQVEDSVTKLAITHDTVNLYIAYGSVNPGTTGVAIVVKATFTPGAYNTYPDDSPSYARWIDQVSSIAISGTALYLYGRAGNTRINLGKTLTTDITQLDVMVAGFPANIFQDMAAFRDFYVEGAEIYFPNQGFSPSPGRQFQKLCAYVPD